MINIKVNRTPAFWESLNYCLENNNDFILYNDANKGYRDYFFFKEMTIISTLIDERKRNICEKEISQIVCRSYEQFSDNMKLSIAGKQYIYVRSPRLEKAAKIITFGMD